MTTYKPLIVNAGNVYQLDDPDGLAVSHITGVDYIDFDIVDGDSVPHAEGRLHWHDADGTLSLGMPGGSVELQLGQEVIVRAKNTTGNDVLNGTIVYPTGSAGDHLEFGIASNNAVSFPANQPFGITTENIANNQLGYVTVFGRVRDIDTSTFNEGDLLYLGVNGAFTATPPDAPRSLALCGAVVRKHATEGVVMFRWGESLALNTLADVYAPFGGSSDGDTIGWVTANNRFELYNPNTPGDYTKAGFFNGTFRETFDLRLNSDGVNVWASLERSGGGDLTLQWSNGQFPYDCTPAQTINLTPGTDASPQSYYLYIPHTTNTLTSNTGLWPLGVEVNKIAYVLVPSAQFVLDHGGGYINQNFNDHLSDEDSNGHMQHIAMKIRQQGADWYSGVSPDGATTSYFTINTGNVYWKSTTGLVSQMHPHTVPAIDTSNTDVMIVVNDPDSTYNHIQNLYTDITKDSTGNSIATNRYFKLVFWGVANKSGEGDFIMCNLPSGTYTSGSSAENDISGYAYYSFPREFDIESGTAYLICETVFQKQGTGWSHYSTSDLRGKSPSKIAGGGGTGTNDHGALGGLGDDDHTQYALADGTRDFTGNVTVNASLGVDDNITGNQIFTNSNATIGGTLVAAAASITGNISANVISFTTANMDGYLEAYAGTPTNNQVLTWITANSRAEFADAAGGGGSGASITSNATYYLSPTGNDSNDGTTVNTAWATIGKVYDNFQDDVIADDVMITVIMEDGQYTFNSAVTISHPQSRRITITGNNSYTISSSNIVSISGTAPNRSMVLTVNDTGNCAVGDHIRIWNAGSGTRGVLIGGASEITSVNTSNNTITCNFFKQNTNLDPTGAATSNITIYKTKIDWNACDGIEVINEGCLNIDNVGMDGVDRTYNGIYTHVGGTANVGSDGVSLLRFADGFMALYGSFIDCQNSAAGGCTRCYYVGYHSFMNSSYSVGNGSYGSMVNVNHNAVLKADDMDVHGGASHGVVCTNARINGDTMRHYGFSDHGAIYQQGAHIHCQNSVWAWNVSRGFLAQFGCFVEFQACNIVSNTGTGAYFHSASFGRCDSASSSIQYNGNGGLYCGYNSTCSRSSATILNNTSWQLSPTPVNTVGNVEAFIH